MKKVLFKFSIIFSFLLIISCQKDTTAIVEKGLPKDIDIPEKIYYESEIFSDEFLSIYNKWHLTSYPDPYSNSFGFQHLLIQPIGIYKIFRNDSLLAYGKIEIMDSSNAWLNFIPDSVLKENPFPDYPCPVSVTDSTLTIVYDIQHRAMPRFQFKSCKTFDDPGYYQKSKKLNNISVYLVKMNDSYYKKLHFPSAQTGYVLYSQNLIFKTSDGGDTWQIIDKFNDISLYNIYFIDENIGFVTGDNSIFKTVDGGLSWIETALPILDKYSRILGIYFIDQNTGFAGGPSGLLLTSSDGGNSWQKYDFSDVSPQYAIENFKFLDQQQGFFYTIKEIYHTQDGGEIWVKLKDPVFSNPTGLCITNQAVWYISVSYDRHIKKTIDSGNSWQDLKNSPTQIRSMHFWTSEKGIAFGLREYSSGDCHIWYSVIHVTEDGGVTWQGDASILTDYYNSINVCSFPDEKVGYIIANNNVLKLKLD